MFAVVLNNRTLYDGIKFLEDAKSLAKKLGEDIPAFKPIRVVEIKELNKMNSKVLRKG